MKLSLPLVCVALLGVGVWPVTAALPKSFSDETNLDRTKAQRAIDPDPSLVNPSTQDDRAQWWASANAVPSQKPIAPTTPSQSDELEVKLPPENSDAQLNSDSTVDSEDDRELSSVSPRIEPTATQAVVPSDDREPSSVSPHIEPTATQSSVPTASTPRLDETDIPNTNVEGLLQRDRRSFTKEEGVQISQSVVRVTGVRLKPTASGLEVILETPSGQLLQAETRIEGKNAIVEISNAQLVLADGKEFRVNNPDAGISLIAVNQLENNRILVIVTGEKVAPVGEIVKTDSSLVFSLTPNQEEVELVVTATRTEESTLDVPRSVTVIDREEIEQQTATARDLQDILGKTVPGLTPPREQQYGPTLRGRNPLILIDGVPMSGNFTTGFIRDWRTIDPSAVERIEVVRGPSAVYGDGATGGVINIITRRATEEFRATSQIGVNASLTHPNDSFGYNIQQSISGREGNIDFLTSFGLSTTGDFFDAEGDRIPLFDDGASNSRSINFLGKIGVDFTQDQRLQFTFNHFRDPQNYSFIRDPIVDSLPGRQKARALEVGRLRFMGTRGPGNTSSVATLNYTNQNLFGSELGLQAYYRNTENFGAFFDRRSFAPEAEFPLQRSIQASERFGGRLQIETPLFESTSLLWGADYSQENISEKRDYFSTEIFDSSGFQVLDKIGQGTIAPVFNIESLGLFAQLQWDLSDRVLLSGGVRQERYSVSLPSYTNADNNDIGGGDRNINGTVFNAGAVFKITPRLSLFSNFAQGFSLPDVVRILRRPPANFDFDRDIKISEPIKVDNYEIGMRGEWPNLQSSLSVFYSKSELGGNVVFDDPSQSGRLVRAPRRDYGVEAAIDWQPGGGWQLGSTLTYTEGENDIDEDGNFLAISSFDISPIKLTAYIAHQTTPGWQNRLQFLYVGDRDRAFNDGVENIPIESYLVVDYISTIKLGPGSLVVGIENLLNNQYSTATAQSIGGFADSNNYAARGRTLSVNYRIDW